MNDDSLKSPEKIAVICVHGVADQSRFDTSRYFAIGIADEEPDPDLKLQNEDATKSDATKSAAVDGRNVSYVERCLHIRNELKSFEDVAEANALNDDAPDAQPIEYPSSEIVKRVNQLYADAPGSEEEKFIKAASATNKFATGKKLEEFQPNESDRVYLTNVIETTVNKKRTDFYEIYWGDLSRVNGSFFQIIASFYRLVFVLCRITNNVRDFGHPVFRTIKFGWLFRWLGWYSTFILAIIVPALNLGMIGVALTVVPYLVFGNGDDGQSLDGDGAHFQRLIATGLMLAVLICLILSWCWPTKRVSRTKVLSNWPRTICIGLVAYSIIAVISCAVVFYVFKTNDTASGKESLRVTFSLVFWFLIYSFVMGAIGTLLDRQYGEKSSQWAFGIVGLILAVLPLLFCLDLKKTSYLPGNLSLVFAVYAAQYLLVILGVAWAIWAALSLITTVWSLFVRSKWRVRNAVWTTQIANSVSGMMMTLVTIGIWFAVINSGIIGVFVTNDEIPEKKFMDWESSELLLVEPFASIQTKLTESSDSIEASKADKNGGDLLNLRFTSNQQGPSETAKIRNTIVYLTQVSALTFSVAFIGLAILFVVFLVSLLSVIFAELPSSVVHPFRKPTDGGKTYDANDSQQLGKTLTQCFVRVGQWARVVLPMTLLVMFLQFVLVQPSFPPAFGVKEKVILVFSSLSLWAVGIFAAALIGIATKVLPGSAAIANGLDVASDVVNWLRFAPVKRNVTSQIYARYDSILKQVSNQGYTRVVILAHSLGSLISVDLLRYWHEVEQENRRQDGKPATRTSHEFSSADQGGQGESDANKLRPLTGLKLPSIPHVLTNSEIKIDLVTFGSPLNQLLGMRFTTQYGWCRSEHSDVPAGNNLWHQNKLICDPDELLGIDSWSNIYCSGDYVGRHLWHSNENDGQDSNWIPTSDDNNEKNVENSKEGKPQIEFCIGAGAHTKYGAYYPPAVNKFRTAVRDLIGCRNTFLKTTNDQPDQSAKNPGDRETENSRKSNT